MTEKGGYYWRMILGAGLVAASAARAALDPAQKSFGGCWQVMVRSNAT
jgi:hypothetical protein